MIRDCYVDADGTTILLGLIVEARYREFTYILKYVLSEEEVLRLLYGGEDVLHDAIEYTYQRMEATARARTYPM